MNSTGMKTSSAAVKNRVDLINTQAAPQTLLNPDNYVEKQRPNFYNVIKKLREARVSH